MPRGGDHYSGFDGGDDGLDDDEDFEEQIDDAGDDNELEVTSTRDESQESTNSRNTESNSSTPDEIPHRVRYDSPKDGRDHAKTLVFTSEDKKRLSDLETLAESTFDEEVYRLDVYLAGLRAGLANDDDRFLEEMREIGYGYFE